MKQFIAFTWGYWGWGNRTKEFVRMVDAIERSRGRRAPLFVDIRFRRSGRAAGFQQNAFERVTGPRRYKWMQGLGNSRIGSGRGGIKIFDPSAANDLLDVIAAASRQKRRVLFFCQCKYPRYCHRAKVASLLRKVATRHGINLTTIEWPGGEPVTARLQVPERILKGVLRGAARIPLPQLRGNRLRMLASLPWCSRVKLYSNGTVVPIIAGPARLEKDWFIPILGPEIRRKSDTLKSLEGEAMQLRRSCGFLSSRKAEAQP
jgi:hypothetical protein